MKVILAKDCPQGSDLWWTAKRGVPSASNFDRIVTGRGKLSKQAGGFIAELVADICCLNPNYFTEKGRPVNTYAMQQGRDTEPEARRWYELESGLPVAEVGFCLDDDFRFGCSPDGLIGLRLGCPCPHCVGYPDGQNCTTCGLMRWLDADEPEGEWQGLPFYSATATGGLELKCPLLHTHVGYLMAGTLPREYVPQVHGQMVVCGLPWVEFCSYAIGQLHPLRLRVEPNEYTQTLRAAMGEFWESFSKAKEQFLGQPPADKPATRTDPAAAFPGTPAHVAPVILEDGGQP